MAAFGLGFAVVSRYLPDYEELRREQEHRDAADRWAEARRERVERRGMGEDGCESSLLHTNISSWRRYIFTFT